MRSSQSTLPAGSLRGARAQGLGLTPGVLHGLSGLAVQLERGEREGPSVRHAPSAPRCSEKPYTKGKSTSLYRWHILVCNSYYPSLEESSHACEIKAITLLTTQQKGKALISHGLEVFISAMLWD